MLQEELILEELGRLEGLDGLGGLREIRGELVVISRNPSLRSLSGLERLERIEGALNITNNPSLPQAEIDAFLARVDVAGPITVDGNGP